MIFRDELARSPRPAGRRALRRRRPRAARAATCSRPPTSASSCRTSPSATCSSAARPRWRRHPQERARGAEFRAARSTPSASPSPRKEITMRKTADSRSDRARRSRSPSGAASRPRPPQRRRRRRSIVANEDRSPAPTGQADRWGDVQVTIVVTQDDDDDRRQEDRQADRSRRSRCPSTRTTPTARVYISQQALPLLSRRRSRPQSANIYIDLGRDLHERRLRAVAAGGDLEGQGLVTAALPGMRRVEQIMGMPIVVDVRDDDVGERAARRASSTGSAAVDATLQHVQRRQRDHADQPRRARGRRRAPRRARGPRPLRGAARGDARLLRRARRAATASTRPASSRAGPSIARPRSSTRRAARTSPSAPAATSVVRGRRAARDCWRVGIQHPTIADKVAARRRRRAISRSRPPAPTRAATTSSIRTRAGRRAACSR